MIARATVGAKPNGFRVLGTAAQAFLRVVNHLERPGRGLQQHFTGCGRAHRSSVTGEDGGARQGFELPELMAEGRSGETETLGGIGQPARFRDRGNEPEMPQIEGAIAEKVARHIE